MSGHVAALDRPAYTIEYQRVPAAVLFFVRPLPYVVAEKIALDLDCARGIQMSVSILQGDEDNGDDAVTLVVVAAHSIADNAARWTGESLAEFAPEVSAIIADAVIAQSRQGGVVPIAADFVAGALEARSDEVHRDDNGIDYVGGEDTDHPWWVRVHRCKCSHTKSPCGGTWCAPAGGPR